MNKKFNSEKKDFYRDLEILHADISDSRDIWEWRNDEISRKMFISTDSVSWESHSKWYEISLNSPNEFFYIGKLNSKEKVGVCRFSVDTLTNIAEVSINLNPLHRNKKLSSNLLSKSITMLLKKQMVDFVAKIKKINISSIKCFENCGFILEQQDSEYYYYRKQVNKLSFKFIGNACGIFIGKNGSRILCDPWLVNGVFEGSWCHYPKIETTINDLRNIDAIYISHLHPDHFDERFFDFDKSTPLIVLDHEPNFLIKKLLTLGYKNLIKIRNQETIEFKEFKLTMFSPFARHIFYDAEIGNLIDSALLISCDEISALNTNDNTPSIESSNMIHQKFGPISLLMLNYNAAGPYPSCFDNLTEQEKLCENDRILTRNFNFMKEIIQAIKPKLVLPFAGSYVLGGNLNFKNKYLGTTTWEKCAEWLVHNDINPTRVVLLRENDILNIEYGKANNKYKFINLLEMNDYMDTISHLKYPYQLENIPNKSQLIADIERASIAMKKRMINFGISSKFRVILNVFDEKYQIYPIFEPFMPNTELEERLECKMDERLLRNILDKKSHWNNAEIGAHISFNRYPNIYEPDLHTGLQFFHI